MVNGIDLGTSYSAVAALNDGGKPEIVKHLDGNSTTPSVVHFEVGDNIVMSDEVITTAEAGLMQMTVE